MQTNWVCSSEAQWFCKNDSDSSQWLSPESSHSVKNVTRVESPFFLTWFESSLSPEKSWLESRYHCRWSILCNMLAVSCTRPLLRGVRTLFFWLRIWSCLVNFESASSPTPLLPWCKQSDSCLTPHQQKSCIFHIISTKWAPFYLLHCKHSSHNLLYAWLELMPESILPPRFWRQQAWQKWS